MQKAERNGRSLTEMNIEDMIIEMKNISELMVDLAYSALFYNNKELAEEVLKLENITDKLHDDIQRLVIENTIKEGNPERALVLLKLATSTEAVADAASEISDAVLRGIEPHPVIELSILESDAIITKAQVSNSSVLVGKTLGETKLASRTGMWTLLIERGGKLIIGPNENTKIEVNDIIFVKGPKESEKDFMKIASGKKKKI
ncbi:MAG: PhoU domain-containing protein [Candidatus Thermoplasmatota archaeon]|nr:PhoU domain-containing protein [Candidatus Thermoplasmatota archaeon]